MEILGNRSAHFSRMFHYFFRRDQKATGVARSFVTCTERTPLTGLLEAGLPPSEIAISTWMISPILLNFEAELGMSHYLGDT